MSTPYPKPLIISRNFSADEVLYKQPKVNGEPRDSEYPTTETKFSKNEIFLDDILEKHKDCTSCPTIHPHPETIEWDSDRKWRDYSPGMWDIQNNELTWGGCQLWSSPDDNRNLRDEKKKRTEHGLISHKRHSFAPWDRTKDKVLVPNRIKPTKMAKANRRIAKRLQKR